MTVSISGLRSRRRRWRHRCIDNSEAHRLVSFLARAVGQRRTYDVVACLREVGEDGHREWDMDRITCAELRRTSSYHVCADLNKRVGVVEISDRDAQRELRVGVVPADPKRDDD